MPFKVSKEEILETINMVQGQNLDIRTITMGINLLDCREEDGKKTGRRVYDKITRLARDLVGVGEEIQRDYGIPIINKRISVTPIAMLVNGLGEDDIFAIALELDRAAAQVGVNFLGGFSALVHKGYSSGDYNLMQTIPRVLAATERVCSSVNLGTTKSGINMDAVYDMGKIIKATAQATADRDGLGCAKLVVFCNAAEDNPFMAGAFHGPGEPETVLNIGISGPGVVATVVKNNPGCDLGELAHLITPHLKSPAPANWWGG